MFIYKVPFYVLLAIESYKISVLCWDPLVSPNYVKQAASNQASANERFRPTSWYDSAPSEYVNDNEKYDFTRTKIIHKIKSSAGVPKDSGLIEKKTMEINHGSDYNSVVREASNSEMKHKVPNADQHEKFFIELVARGKCMGKCQVKPASVEPSVLIMNDAPTSYRLALKRMTQNHILNSENGERVNVSDVNDIAVTSPSIVIGPVPLTSTVQYDATLASELNRRTKNHRARRQVRYIPAARPGLNIPRQPYRQPDITSSINLQRPSTMDSAFIHSLLGVFDNAHPVLAPNVRPINPNQVIITPPRYINDAKIYPSYPPASPGRPRPGPTGFLKYTERNPSGFGESERVLTTDVTSKVKQPQMIHDHFLPTVKPHTIPKITSQHNYDNIVEANYPKNHRIPSTIKTVQSPTNDLYNVRETPEQHETSKHHGKDTKYDRYGGKYTFQYHVADQMSVNDFGHQETRNEEITRGHYHVRLPDGRLQRVTYHVDNGGYHADVSYEPKNKYNHRNNMDAEYSNEEPY